MKIKFICFKSSFPSQSQEPLETREELEALQGLIERLMDLASSSSSSGGVGGRPGHTTTAALFQALSATAAALG